MRCFEIRRVASLSICDFLPQDGDGGVLDGVARVDRLEPVRDRSQDLQLVADEGGQAAGKRVQNLG